MPLTSADRARLTQPERRARTRSALLEAAARGLSRNGYGNLVLERVAREAGYTRGALYHLFASKEDLARAVVAWVEETWWAEMSQVIADNADPVEALLGMARAHAVFCRRDIARVHMVLSVEFSGQDHPVGRAIEEAGRRLVTECARLITAGRRRGAIPPGPSPRVLALAYLGAVEGVVINLAGQAPFDELLAEGAVRGVLGLPSAPASSRSA
ncbi:MAG: TetR/AcrR family transcriptional regulator [Actinomycetota bacterium]|nr:TetR/AcrR family transcriptional regulator [Actinomycetota bacterium]